MSIVKSIQKSFHKNFKLFLIKNNVTALLLSKHEGTTIENKF